MSNSPNLISEIDNFLCRYLHQVVDEALRCSVLAPYSARISDVDIEMGDYVIPAGVSQVTGT